MSFSACDRLVKAGDPDRWLSAQAAPPAGRRALMAIYATNLLIARAPWASPEPLVAQMRLQWWADEIGKIYHGQQVTTHEILPALREVIFDHTLPRGLFETLIEARMQDIYADPPENRAAFDAYIEATSGSVMALAAKALGAPDTAQQTISDFAYGAGVATLLRAVPALAARGRQPLTPPVTDIVATAENRLTNARTNRATLPHTTTPALLAGWRADATLAQARKHPDTITDGLLEESPFQRSATLRWRRLTGKW